MLDLEPRKNKTIMTKSFDSVKKLCFSFFKCLQLIENKAIHKFQRLLLANKSNVCTELVFTELTLLCNLYRSP